MEAFEAHADSPHTPQRGDIVDKLLNKLLAKQNATKCHSRSPTKGGGGDDVIDSYEVNHSRDLSPSRESKNPRVARLAQQLASAREALSSSSSANDNNSDANCRIAALEAKLYQLETESISAVAAKRRAEQDLAATKAQLSAVSKSSALQKVDWEQSMNFLRSQVAAKSEEATRLDHHVKKLSTELAQVRKTSETQLENAVNTQRRLRERVAMLERQLDEAKDSLGSAETRKDAAESAKTCLSQVKCELEGENGRLRQQAEGYKQEAGALRCELEAARDQLEAAVARATGSREAEEALRDVLSQRGAIVQENRGLRGEVARLQTALLEEKAAREQLKHKADLKLAAGAHERAMLSSKLEAKSDEVKTTRALIATLKADAERAVDTHESAISALKEKVVEARRGSEDVKRRAAEELQLAEARWEEKTAATVENAVSRHQRRIQDLELQLSHQHHHHRHHGAATTTITSTATTLQSNTSGANWTVPGGYAASVLDYIPRSEHLRLLEVRSTAREAEMRAEVAAVRAAAAADGHARVAAVTRELQEVRGELHKCVLEGVEGKERAACAEHALTMLRARCEEFQKELARKTQQESTLSGKIAILEKEKEKHAVAVADAAEKLAVEVGRSEKACAALEAALGAAKTTEQTLKAAEKQRIELEMALSEEKARCSSLTLEMAQLQRQLTRVGSDAETAHQTAVASAERANTLQQRCSLAETEQVALKRQIESLTAEVELKRAAVVAVREEESRQCHANLLTLLSQIESAVLGGGAMDAKCTSLENQINQTGIEARIEVVISKCRQLHADAISATLAAQRAQQEATDAQTRATAIESHYMAVQQQYVADMAALEQTAREQVQGVRSEAAEVLTGLRRASVLLQEQMRGSGGDGGGDTMRNRWSVTSCAEGSLASEVEELKTRLAEQAGHAEEVEKKEMAFTALLAQLSEQLKGGAAEKSGGGNAVAVVAANS